MPGSCLRLLLSPQWGNLAGAPLAQPHTDPAAFTETRTAGYRVARYA